MTTRDRLVLAVVAALAVLGAFWVLLVSPERKTASKLSSEVSTASAQLATVQGEASNALVAQQRYSAAYTSVVNLGKAVPPNEEVPSLIYQLAQASNQKNVEFSSITSGASGASTPSSSSAATPTTAPAGFTQMPFTFVFTGGFSDLYHLFLQLNKATVRTTSGGLRVSGRLLTLQGVKLEPVGRHGARRKRRAETYGHDHGNGLRAPGRAGSDGRRDAGLAVAGHRIAKPGQHFDRDERLDTCPRRDRGAFAMSDFFDSLKSDLLDRRLIPVLGLLAVVLIAAIAYAVLGGSSAAAPNVASAPVTPVAKVPGIAVSEVKTADVTASAETTSGYAAADRRREPQPVRSDAGRQAGAGGKRSGDERLELERGAQDRARRRRVRRQPRPAPRRLLRRKNQRSLRRRRSRKASRRPSTSTSCSARPPLRRRRRTLR